MAAFRVNTVAPFVVARAFADHVAASDRRVMAFLSSRLGSIAQSTGGFYHYRAAKAALNMVVKNLAADLQGRGITSVALHPGWVRTNMGGSMATLSPAESVRALKPVIDGLGPADNGRFIDHRGDDLPW